MSNKKSKEAVEEKEPPVLPRKAFGMYPLKQGVSTVYVLVEIGYDPESGDVGFVKELARDIKEDIIDKLKSANADYFFRSDT
jgi:hypothetical protein